MKILYGSLNWHLILQMGTNSMIGVEVLGKSFCLDNEYIIHGSHKEVCESGLF